MKTLIVKYLSDKLTEEELLKLRTWLEDSNNRKIFEAYVRDSHDLSLSVSKANMQTAYSKIWNKIQEQEKSVKKLFPNWTKYAVAASIALLISLTFIFNKDKVQVLEPIIVNNNIKIGTDKAILTLEDGTSVALEKGQQFISDNVKSNGEDLIYTASTINLTKVVPSIPYNYITIPRGGQYHVKLADGTEVWLNSESKLKYPISFIDGEERKVELVYGEAYFDVSPSTEHKGAKFKVFNNAQEIEVLGTEFNVKAYKDEDFIYTTLLEGKVSINNSINKETLSPSQQAIVNTNNNEMTVKNVVDLYSIAAWRNGVFSFKDKPLKDIMKVLSRWYDTEVIFTNEDVKTEKFTGVLGKEQTIEDILFTIYNTNNTVYEINNKAIIFR